MNQLWEFIARHWELWLALLVILALILINELLSQKKRAAQLTTGQAIDLINHDQATIFDLREAEAFNSGHIINAVRATMNDFSEQRMEKYKKKPLILVCARGMQSQPTASKLKELGFEQATVLSGGMAAWQAANLPIVRGKK